VVVENSDDESYRDAIVSGFKNVKWIQNPTHLTGSEANAIALTKGVENVDSEYVFVCHNDVAVCHETWMEYLMARVAEGNALVGMCYDSVPERIKAAHQSGILVKASIGRAVSMYPVNDASGRMIMDVGDSLTKYCRDHDLKYRICDNTFNNPESVDRITEEKYREFNVDRALNDNGDVMFMHLGRGTSKYNKEYYRRNRVMMTEWLTFVRQLLGLEREIAYYLS
jgi:hypothetical protein